MVRNDISQYDNQCQYIKNAINSDELKKKYQAENMIAKFDAIMAPLAAYAHELLHCFGAYDYYENSCISQTYVDYQLNSNSNDIMYTVNDENFITNEFSLLMPII